MDASIQTVIVDLDAKIPQTAWANKNDYNSRKIRFLIRKKNKPVDLTGLSVDIFMTDPLGVSKSDTVTVTNPTAGESIYTIPRDITKTQGITKATLVFRKSEYQLISFEFDIKVNRTNYEEGKITSSDNFSILIKALDVVKEYDEALKDAAFDLEKKYTNRLNGFDAQLDNIEKKGDITPLDFGAKGDGLADDTIPFQKFVDFIQTNSLKGRLLNKKYRLTNTIIFKSLPSWSMVGENANSTTIIMDNSNLPIFKFEKTPSSLHSVRLISFSLKYKTNQPSTNINSNMIQLEGMLFEGNISDIFFENGYYGIKVMDGCENFWGCVFDELRFGGLMTGGAIKMSNINAVPNNKFGRILCNCESMTNIAFFLKGYNFVIDNIEFLENHNGVQLFFLQNGTYVSIGSIKLENGTFTSSAKDKLIEISHSCYVDIKTLSIVGNNLNISKSIYLVGTSGQSPNTISNIVIGGFSFNSIINPQSDVYLLGTIKAVVNSFKSTSDKIFLVNQASSDAGQYVKVLDWVNGRLSNNKGDSDYTIELGSENIVDFSTTLTNPRVVNLPHVNNNLFNSLSYKIFCNCNPTTTNTLTIKCDGNVKYTFNKNGYVELTYRRNPSTANGGWTITQKGDY